MQPRACRSPLWSCEGCPPTCRGPPNLLQPKRSSALLEDPPIIARKTRHASEKDLCGTSSKMSSSEDGQQDRKDKPHRRGAGQQRHLMCRAGARLSKTAAPCAGSRVPQGACAVHARVSLVREERGREGERE